MAFFHTDFANTHKIGRYERKIFMEITKEKQELKELYRIYGFTISEETENYIVFTHLDGYFNNAEIVAFGEEEDVSEIVNKYSQIGYAARKIQFGSVRETHDRLFNGFFRVKITVNRLRQECNGFYELQKAKSFNKFYEYVEPNYILNGDSRNSGLVRAILGQLNQEGPQLVIMEAAAGFGKTCTSYELLDQLLALDKGVIPIFTELSKNRKAALFRYVLLDEIDKKFTGLSSTLVMWEIKNGRVPLIIDGFDELLSKANDKKKEENDYDEDAQTMLDTIADLFQNGSKAKVILTSRKSAILTGIEFERWADEKVGDCCVTRISIETPSVKDWIGSEKFHYLEECMIPMENLANPILLSYMRSIPVAEFRSTFSASHDVVQVYFTALLERERERQSLLLSIDEQYRIMIDLARWMVELNIDTEEYAFIKDIFVDIVSGHFSEYYNRYLFSEEKPTLDQFASKLTNHALLNRKSLSRNEIGFINDFIFGIFIGEGINQGLVNLDSIDRKYIDISATAMAAKEYQQRKVYYQKIGSVLPELNCEQRLDIELKLLSTIDHNYRDQYISSREFNEHVILAGDFYFSRCIFYNCVFNKCMIATSVFDSCSFNSCQFYDVKIDKDTEVNRNLIFYGNCTGHEELQRLAMEEIHPEPVKKDYEVEVLSRFQKGRSLGMTRNEDLLVKASKPEDHELLGKALESLKRKGFVSRNGHYWNINRDHIVEIREMLEIN